MTIKVGPKKAKRISASRKTVAAQMRAHIEEHEITQAQLARLIGASPANISRVLAGGNVGSDLMHRMMDAIGRGVQIEFPKLEDMEGEE